MVGGCRKRSSLLRASTEILHLLPALKGAGGSFCKNVTEPINNHLDEVKKIKELFRLERCLTLYCRIHQGQG